MRRGFFGAKRAARGLQRQEGQAAFEFILILPFFVMFLLTLVDLGILTYEYVTISSASRDAVRYASVNCEDGSCNEGIVQTRALNRSSGLLSSLGEVFVGWLDGDDDGNTNHNRGDSVVVRIEHDYDWLFLDSFLPIPSIKVFACAEMRLEREDTGAPLPAPDAGKECT